MSGSIATHPDAPLDAGRIERLLRTAGPGKVAIGWFLLAAVVYVLSNASRTDFYDHFVWQAHAFLSGRAEIEWPVSSGPNQNAYFQDVLPIPGTGLAHLPFPPLPALVLLPFVAVFGLDTNGAMVAAVLGAVNVALCWLVLVGATRRYDAASGSERRATAIARNRNVEATTCARNQVEPSIAAYHATVPNP